MVDTTPVSGTPDVSTPSTEDVSGSPFEQEAKEATAEETEREPAEEALGAPSAEAEEEPPTAVDYAAMEAEDLRMLHTLFPELTQLRSLSQLSNPARYGELRDLGLSAKEAYLATEGRIARPSDNRAHLHSAVPRTVSGTDGAISSSELAAARELFDGLSDHEIRRLYKRVSQSNK